MMSAMTAADWIADALGLLGLVGGTIGFFRSRSADKRSEQAAKDAAAAMLRSATAGEESAEALKRIAQLQEPVEDFEWKVRQITNESYTLHTEGKKVPRN